MSSDTKRNRSRPELGKKASYFIFLCIICELEATDQKTIGEAFKRDLRYSRYCKRQSQLELEPENVTCPLEGNRVV